CSPGVFPHRERSAAGSGFDPVATFVLSSLRSIPSPRRFASRSLSWSWSVQVPLHSAVRIYPAAASPVARTVGDVPHRDSRIGGFMGNGGWNATALLPSLRLAGQPSASPGGNRAGQHAELAWSVYRMAGDEPSPALDRNRAPGNFTLPCFLGISSVAATGVWRRPRVGLRIFSLSGRCFPGGVPRLQPGHEFSSAPASAGA